MKNKYYAEAKSRREIETRQMELIDDRSIDRSIVSRYRPTSRFEIESRVCANEKLIHSGPKFSVISAKEGKKGREAWREERVRIYGRRVWRCVVVVDRNCRGTVIHTPVITLWINSATVGRFDYE